MTILVFGQSGQVATELARHGGDRVDCAGRDRADLTDPAACAARSYRGTCTNATTSGDSRARAKASSAAAKSQTKAEKKTQTEKSRKTQEEKIGPPRARRASG